MKYRSFPTPPKAPSSRSPKSSNLQDPLAIFVCSSFILALSCSTIWKVSQLLLSFIAKNSTFSYPIIFLCNHGSAPLSAIKSTFKFPTSSPKYLSIQDSSVLLYYFYLICLRIFFILKQSHYRLSDIWNTNRLSYKMSQSWILTLGLLIIFCLTLFMVIFLLLSGYIKCHR